MKNDKLYKYETINKLYYKGFARTRSNKAKIIILCAIKNKETRDRRYNPVAIVLVADLEANERKSIINKKNGSRSI